jgi:hypothetical protein
VAGSVASEQPDALQKAGAKKPSPQGTGVPAAMARALFRRQAARGRRQVRNKACALRLFPVHNAANEASAREGELPSYR